MEAVNNSMANFSLLMTDHSPVSLTADSPLKEGALGREIKSPPL